MPTESGRGESNEREQVKQEIVSALSALSDEPKKMAGRLEVRVVDEPGGEEIQIDGLSADDVELFSRIVKARGITVEELFAQAIDDWFQKSVLSWLAKLWKEWFAGWRLMLNLPGSQPAPLKDENPA